MIRRFIRYYKPHTVLFIFDMLASLLVSVIGLSYSMITNEMMSSWIDEGKDGINKIVFFGALLLGLYFIRMLLRFFIQYYGHVIGVKMQAQMRNDLFNKLQKLPYKYYDNHETGKIMSRMTNDLMDVSELAHHGPENLFICGIMVVGSFLYLLSINVYLTLIVFACVPVLVTISLLLSFLQIFLQICVVNILDKSILHELH